MKRLSHLHLNEGAHEWAPSESYGKAKFYYLLWALENRDSVYKSVPYSNEKKNHQLFIDQGWKWLNKLSGSDSNVSK